MPFGDQGTNHNPNPHLRKKNWRTSVPFVGSQILLFGLLVTWLKWFQYWFMCQQVENKMPWILSCLKLVLLSSIYSLNHTKPMTGLYIMVSKQVLLFYRPQRSCGKVMFSKASVILFTGGYLVWQTPFVGRHSPPAADSYCSGRYASYWNAFLLPSANEVCEGYVFTRVCHSVHSGVSPDP